MPARGGKTETIRKRTVWVYVPTEEHRKKWEKLAEKAELAPTYVSDIERGRENISVDALARIAKALHVAIRDLFRGA